VKCDERPSEAAKRIKRRSLFDGSQIEAWTNSTGQNAIVDADILDYVIELATIVFLFV
jgi:hypothetical protein